MGVARTEGAVLERALAEDVGSVLLVKCNTCELQH